MLNVAAAVFLSIAFLSTISGTSGETFTALIHVENAYRAESDLAVDIRSYVRKEEERLQKLSNLAQEFEHQSTDSSRSNLEHRLANPVSAYLTIKDLHYGAKAVEDLLSLAVDNSRDFYDKSVITSELLPDDKDIQGAASALLRLQDTYEIPAYKLVEGGFLDDKVTHDANSSDSIPVLTVDDCVDIGKVAYNAKDFYHAVVWLQLALEKLSAAASFPGMQDNAQRIEILDYLSYSLWKQGNTKRALHLTEEILVSQPTNERFLANKQYYIKELGEIEASSATLPELKLSRDLDGYRAGDDFAIYESLCRGEVWQYPMMHQLKCHYSNGNGHPLLRYAPVKTEELYADPRIVFYHQLLSDYEMELIKNLSTPMLHRSGLFSSGGPTVVTNDYRTSKSSWLADEAHPTIRQISKRISALAGLSLDTAELLQVLNYGIGGHYEPHVDFARQQDSNAFSQDTGNRIATFLNYLTDVHSGGATVFPRLGISAWPEKGGAVFWYNLLRNGSGDERTLHAACPVLSGYKWVANKWFHERANEFHRPCAVNEHH